MVGAEPAASPAGRPASEVVQEVLMRFRDPVCGMEIRWEEAVDYAVVGPVIVYFCCPGCAARFREDPARHVDVEGWLSKDPPPLDPHADCVTSPLPPTGGEAPAHRSLRLGAVPLVGVLTLDEVEALITRHWRRLLGARGVEPLRTRVLERALLVCAITGAGEERRPDTDRMLASEVARLRSREMERDRVEAELVVLTQAFDAALREARLETTEVERLQRMLRDGVAEVRDWILPPRRRQEVRR